MFVRVIPNNKGTKETYFCDLVESFRDQSGNPKHRVVVRLGQFDQAHLPYIRAAYAKDPEAEFQKVKMKYAGKKQKIEQLIRKKPYCVWRIHFW